jgi:hypothetical protein
MTKRSPSSIATISAHPMLRPSFSQPGLSFQKSHSFPKTTPMPQDVEASTQNSILEAGGGLESTEPQKSAVRRVRHHCMSDKTLALGVLRTNGEEK